MNEDAVAVVEAHIDEVLDEAYRRMGCVAPRRNGRPVIQMVDAVREETGDEMIIWLEAWRAFLAILWAEGPSPLKALKRLMALTWCVSRENLANMTQAQVGELMGETRAAVSARVRVVYVEFLKAHGFRGTRVPGMKSDAATKAYAKRAEKNVNRKSGRKKGDQRPRQTQKTNKQPKGKTL